MILSVSTYFVSRQSNIIETHQWTSSDECALVWRALYVGPGYTSESEQLVRLDLAAVVTPKLLKRCEVVSSTPMPDS